MGNKKTKVLILAGGTGGHIFPALAIAKALQKQGHQIHWVGTKAGLEALIVPKESIPISFISIAGLRGKRLSSLLVAPFMLMLSLLQSLYIILTVRPTIVLGMGGFVAGPGGIAAWILRVPLVIHEQNAVACVTNKILGRFAMHIFEAFPNSFPNFKDKVLLTGNPLRAEFYTLPSPVERFKTRDHKNLHLLVIGGSRGALALNKFVPEAIKNLSDNCPLEIWHQTGENHLEFTRSLYAQNKIAAKVDAFIDNIIEAYQWADVIVCRAGALTVAELTAVGVASILVPFPYATDDHQTLNARYLTEANAGVLLPHTELQNQKLLPILQTFLDDREKTQQMAISARKLANMDALEKITRKMEIMLS